MDAAQQKVQVEQCLPVSIGAHAVQDKQCILCHFNKARVVIDIRYDAVYSSLRMR